jgi:membrane protein implicated in regulation of membrane protease activity
MHIGLAIKVAFWLVIVGLAALLAPNPAWPEWVARIVLSLGVAIVVTAFVVPLIRNRKNKP